MERNRNRSSSRVNTRTFIIQYFLFDIFYFINIGNLCNYADNNTLYSIGKNLNMVKENLKFNFLVMQKWFFENHMVLNPGKCHYLVLGKRSNSDIINLNGTKWQVVVMKNYLVS